MKVLTRLFIAAVILVGVAQARSVFTNPSRGASPNPVVPATTVSGPEEITVWVNTRSGVYHCPASRWYGSTKQGKFMRECEAGTAFHGLGGLKS